MRVVKGDAFLAEPFLCVAVDADWDRGLLGVALDPDCAANGFVSVGYVVADPYPHHRVSRFQTLGDVAGLVGERPVRRG